MTKHTPFATWDEVLQAPRSAFFFGHTSDTVRERAQSALFAPRDEAVFAQSNARVLVAQAANGTFRVMMLPTQVYAAPPAVKDMQTYPGCSHHTVAPH